MKVIVNHTVVVGKGDKARPVLPSPLVVDTKKLGIADEEVLALIAAGHLASAELLEADPEGGAGGLDGGNPGGGQ